MPQFILRFTGGDPAPAYFVDNPADERLTTFTLAAGEATRYPDRRTAERRQLRLAATAGLSVVPEVWSL